MYGDVSHPWGRLDIPAMMDLILIIGAPDTGKSTLARYLYQRLSALRGRVAYIDGDMGQAALGPPTTMTLALSRPGDDAFPPAGPRWQAFVGDVSPRGHMLPTVVGAHKLVQRARESGASAIVFDTTGLVDPDQGGGALKRAKVELLRPRLVIGLQRSDELEYLLTPLRHSRRVQVVDLPAAQAGRRRDSSERRAYRVSRYRAYFGGSGSLEVHWQELAVFPAPAFATHRLLALEDCAGFTLGLGIVLTRQWDALTLLTPLPSLQEVDALQLGDLTLDPKTFWSSRL